MKNRNFILMMSVSILLVGCGGGSSTESIPRDNLLGDDELAVEIGTGYYVDAAISGVRYQCGTQNGLTDIEGKFSFEKGESCTFKLGDLVLRELSATSLEDNITVFEDNVEVARLLQTTDSDGNSTNGIQILSETHEVIDEQGIEKIPNDDATLLNIQDALEEKNPEAYNGEIVSELEVEAHLSETRESLADEGRRTQNDVEREMVDSSMEELDENSSLSENSEDMVSSEEINTTQTTETLEVLDSEPRDSYEGIIENLSLFRSENSLQGQQDIASNEVLISFKEGMANSAEFKAKLEVYLNEDEHSLERFSSIGTGHIKARTKSADELKAILLKPEFTSYVESVSLNYIMHLTLTNDTNYNELWAIENSGQIVNGVGGTADADMDVLEAWDKTTGSSDVIVAVLDTGVDYTHSDLAGNMWQGNINHGYDFAADNAGGNDDDPMPDLPYADNGHFHGTHVAGTIGAVANNSNGITGVAQNVSIMALKVFRPDGTGYTSDILEALNYVSQKIDEGENIVAINASFAGGGDQTDTINQVIKELGVKGVVFCAAAGNESLNNDLLPVYPANYDATNVISIGASDENDNLASFSNYGALTVDVAAPGTNIVSTYPDNQYAYLQGTSMATPNVAGTVALLASYYPDATADELKAMIIDNVDVKSALNGKVITSGRVNANEALGIKDIPLVNVAPLANNDTYVTAYMTVKNLNVLSNDSDENSDILIIDSFTQGLNGIVSQNNNELIYTPNDGFSGEDNFEYTISDGLLTATANVQMTTLAEVLENNDTTDENNETVSELPNMEHNGTRSDMPNMEENQTRPDMPNMEHNGTRVEVPNDSNSSDSELNDEKFVKALSIPALASYEMVEGYKVYNMNINESTTEFFDDIQTKTYGINTNILGETIRVHRGDDIKVVYNNNLPFTTTMHGHGMHVPAIMDGVLNPIASGASWTAQYLVNQKASTNWYHPHYMGKTAEHVYMGLAGLIIVDDDESDALDLPKAYGVDDIPLILQDKRFDTNKQIDYSPTMMEVRRGYLSNTMLVNGVINPHVNVEAKQIRFRVLNASNARVYKLAFSDNRVFKQIATDNAFLEQAVDLSSLVLTPGERAELIVDFNDEMNSSIILLDKNSNLEIMQINVNAIASQYHILPNTFTVNTKYDVQNSVRTRKFSLGMTRGDNGMHMSINGKTMDMMRIDEVVPVDEIEIWEVTNTMTMEHNFHIHATHFYPLERDGSAGNILENEQGYKDTIRVPPLSTVKFILKMTDFPDDDNAYMYHCHFLEHEDDGMMGQFTITTGEAMVNVGNSTTDGMDANTSMIEDNNGSNEIVSNNGSTSTEDTRRTEMGLNRGTFDDNTTIGGFGQGGRG